MAMREGTGQATVDIGPAAAFTYLADPRNAPEWFAGVALDGAPTGPLREGMTWRFVQRLRGGRVVPVRMDAYAFPSRFVWRTQFRWPRTNLAWEMRCEPLVAPNGEPAPAAQASRLTFTIRIEPGPLGWPALALGAWLSPQSLGQRAQRAVESAREVLLARAEVQGGRQPGPSGESRRSRRGRKPGQPRG